MSISWYTTKHTLSQALFGSMSLGDNYEIPGMDQKIHTGKVLSVVREDGSGKSFNVTMMPINGKSGDKEVFHVRTID